MIFLKVGSLSLPSGGGQVEERALGFVNGSFALESGPCFVLYRVIKARRCRMTYCGPPGRGKSKQDFKLLLWVFLLSACWRWVFSVGMLGLDLLEAAPPWAELCNLQRCQHHSCGAAWDPRVIICFFENISPLGQNPLISAKILPSAPSPMHCHISDFFSLILPSRQYG